MIDRRLFLNAVGGAAAGALWPNGTQAARKPNIVMIFIDDLGWPALSCFGARLVETPHLDALAAQGMKFTDAYVTPQCTPSRASLLTGQHTARNGMWHVIPRYYYPYARVKEPRFVENLPRDTFTLSKALQGEGYKTALLGKWHLTQNEDGYYTYLRDRAKHHYGFDYVNPMTDPSEYHKQGDKGVDLLTDEAIGFMKRHRDEPFFVYLSHHTIHGPVLAPEDDIEPYDYRGYPKEGIHNSTYLGAIRHLDQSVGRLMQSLNELDLADDTMLVFLSDNGGVDSLYDNAPLRYGKGSVYEGGVRSPMIVRWPGRVEAGTVCDTPVHIVDFYPTFLEAAGGGRPQDHILDGESLMPLLSQSGEWSRESICQYLPLYDKRWGLTPCASIRRGDYKLIHFFGDYVDMDNGRAYIPEGRVELFNLREDIGERNDLSERMSDKTRAMLDELHAWIRSNGREIPGLNPDFDPDRVFVEAR